MKSIVEKIENGEIKLDMLRAEFNEWVDITCFNDHIAYEISFKMWYDEHDDLIREFAIELTAVYSSEGDEVFVTGKEKEAIEKAIVKRYDEFIHDYI